MRRPHIIWIVLSGTGGSIIAAASISPKEASSNLAAWANVLGFEDPPGFINTSYADTVAIWIGVVVATISFIHYLRIYITTNEWATNFVCSDIFPYRRLITLSEAAVLAYEKTPQGTLVASAAEDMEEGPIAWYATALVDHGKIPVYGKRSPGHKISVLPPHTIAQGMISDTGSSITRYGEDSPSYIDLMIKRVDMKRQIAEFKSWR